MYFSSLRLIIDNTIPTTLKIGVATRIMHINIERTSEKDQLSYGKAVKNNKPNTHRNAEHGVYKTVRTILLITPKSCFLFIKSPSVVHYITFSGWLQRVKASRILVGIKDKVLTGFSGATRLSPRYARYPRRQK